MRTIDAIALIMKQEGIEYLSPALHQLIKEIQPPLIKAMSDLTAAYTIRRLALQERDEKDKALSKHVADFWSGARRRAERAGKPGAMNFFRMPLDGGRPPSGKARENVDLALAMIDGDTKAVENGFLPLQFPSAEELGVLASETAQACDLVERREQAYQAVQDELRVLRKKVDQLLRDVAQFMRYSLSRQDASGQRRTMRRYGFVFEGTGVEEVLIPDPESDIPEDKGNPDPEPSDQSESVAAQAAADPNPM